MSVCYRSSPIALAMSSCRSSRLWMKRRFIADDKNCKPTSWTCHWNANDRVAVVGYCLKKDSTLVPDLLELVAPHTAGDPMSETKWLNCRLCDVQVELASQAHAVSPPLISRLLHAQAYELRLNVKKLESESHPQRDEPFQYIQAQQAHHRAVRRDERCALCAAQRKPAARCAHRHPTQPIAH